MAMKSRAGRAVIGNPEPPARCPAPGRCPARVVMACRRWGLGRKGASYASHTVSRGFARCKPLRVNVTATTVLRARPARVVACGLGSRPHFFSNCKNNESDPSIQ
jgi:hypothetical protein